MTCSTLRWAVGSLLVVIGTMMLVVPHQFTSIAFAVIRPHLDIWGTAFLIPGFCLLAVEVLALPRPFEIVSHLAAGAVLVALAYSFTLMANWPPVPNYGFLGLGTAIAPFVARTRGQERTDGRGDMLPISSGAGAATLGIAMLLLQGQFTSPVFDSFRPHMTWLGILFLLGGASALYVQLLPTPNTAAFVTGHILLGAALVAFCLTSAIPLRAWLGIAYYGGFGIVIAMTPRLARAIRVIDASSLRTRLAFAFAASVGLPPIAVVSIVRRFVGDGSPATNSAWDLSFLLLIGFVVLSALAGIYIAERVTAPLGTLSQAARRLSHGDSSAALPESSLTEMEQLAETFGEMRDKLAARTAERERLLAEAESGQRLLEALMENVPEGITIADAPEARIRMVSRYGRELLGGPHHDKTAGEVANQWTVYEPDGISAMAEANLPLVRAIQQGETVRDVELVQVNEQGARLWLSCNAAPIRNSQGEITGAIVAWRDITARKQAEEALRESRAKLEAALASMTDAVFISDTEGRFIDFNDAFATFHKFRNKAECATTLAEYPDFLEVYMDTGKLAPLDQWAVPRALRGETATNAEYTLRRKDTGETWVGSYSFAPIRDQEGEIVGSVVVGRDITELKQAEKERERLLAAVQRQAAELDATIASASIGIAIYDLSGQLTRLNPAGKEITGHSEEKLRLPIKDRAASVKLEDEHGNELSGEESPGMRALRGERISGEIISLVHDGKRRWLRADAAPIQMPAGQVLGSVMAFADITAQRELAEQRDLLLAAEQEARSLAEKAAKARDEFISIAAHELKTPVTSLMGFSQMLIRQARKNGGQLDTERVLASAEHIDEQSRRLTKLTNQLLDISRLETGKLTLEREERNLSAMVEGLVAVIRQSHPGRTIEVRSEEVRACADALRIEQVVTNLIDNALKFSSSESPVEVEVSKEGEDWARITVRDYGIGIPGEKREHIFERFYQAHAEKYFGGMGIGLSVSKQIVEMHGGTISLEESEGEGSRFVVRLPISSC